MKKAILVEPLRPDHLYDPCIKCTICVTACPVAQTTDAFPGPKQAGPDAQRFRGRDEPVADSWINLCTGCHRCQVACPADIPIAEINAHAKQRYAAAHGRDLATELLTHAFLFMPFGPLFSRLANPLLRQAWSRWFAEKLFGIARQAPMPTFAPRRFSSFAKKYRPQPGTHRVAYFYGCFTDSNDPDVGRAVLKVLAAAGAEAIVPPQNCCGAALLGAGNLAAARQQNERNIASLRDAVKNGCESIVVGSPSCALALSQELSAMLGMNTLDIQEKVVDLFTYLDRRQMAGQLHFQYKDDAPAIQAAFHEACHLTALGFGANALRFFQQVPGVRLRALDAGCCGLAGTFGLKKKTADLARQIGQGVAARVAEWGPEVVLSECEGCRMQITALTGVRTLHPAVLLANRLAGD